MPAALVATQVDAAASAPGTSHVPDRAAPVLAAPAVPEGMQSSSKVRRLRVGDPILRALVGMGAVVVVAAFLALVALLVVGSFPALRGVGTSLVTGRDWNPNPPVDAGSPPESYGALYFIYGTIAASVVALALALPIAVGTAVALVELLPRRLASAIGLMVELLAAVPSIVFGVWGVAVVVPFVRTLGKTLHQRTLGTSLLAGSFVLAVMVLPILCAVSRDMLRAVPRMQRDAALALGATQWEVTWRVVIPAARGGLLAGAILALGRAVGETMAVIFVVGMTWPASTGPFDWNLFHPGATLPATIATQFPESGGASTHRAALLALGLLLLVITLALNLAARGIGNRLARRLGGRA